MKTFNKKGFTLVELLAVIVILAIIILFALPAVVSTMETARAGSFKNEINEVVNQVQTAFSRKTMASSPDIKNVNIGGTTYRYMCITLANLYKEGYSQKAQFAAEGTAYKGYYQVFIPANGSSVATYIIRFTNGQFTANDLSYSYTSSDKYTPTFEAVTDEWGKCPAEDPTEIPNKTPSASGE